jgi:hypothetical protein
LKRSLERSYGREMMGKEIESKERRSSRKRR